ncbi:glycosyltransferase [Streptomyces sp. TRM66268-LWL]|uniref:D-inositol 3-phosphate glycosyltransferase n=1 Tax=Streptomyces polyasparticus TaxID=2767826 RepID=A0ABR7SED8_9ACTN|nr:glycosyltransferase [Streptomyces polyasparticus]MBC9713865.1 glycosyltransferase [Streptomyces polyasparticus]
MKITFLLFDAYGIDGTIRATANLATALAERHDVQIVSYYRTAERMRVPVDERVRVRPLVDLRPSARHDVRDEPEVQTLGAVCPLDVLYASRTPPSALGEQRLADFLRRTDSDVVIATRPYLVCMLAEHGRTDAYLRIGQEHLTRASHSEQVRRDQDAAIDRLDAFVTLSEGDALAYDKALPVRQVLITHIANCCPAPVVEAATGTSRIVVAAGSLVPAKHFDRLIGAFAKVVARHPDWTLRIYGRGRERAALRRRIDELGLHANVFLMGPHSPIDTEWAKGAITVVSSSTEAFGMPIVEAMRLGVPVVATDCDYGPREIISHGRDGLLVPAEGPVEDHLADALCRLIANDAERFRRARWHGAPRATTCPITSRVNTRRSSGRWPRNPTPRSRRAPPVLPPHRCACARVGSPSACMWRRCSARSCRPSPSTAVHPRTARSPCAFRPMNSPRALGPWC